MSLHPKLLLHVEFLEPRQLLSAGDLDVVFPAGRAMTQFTTGPAQIQALAVQVDGRIVAVGQASGNNSAFALARFNLNGALDPSFAATGQETISVVPNQNNTAKAVAIQPDGMIVVAGAAGPNGGQEF